MKFNSAKTETMLFSRKRVKPVHPNLTMDGIVLIPVKEHRHLGLTFTDDGKWNYHISLVRQQSLEKYWYITES